MKNRLIGILILAGCLCIGMQLVGMEPERRPGGLKGRDKPKGRNVSFGKAYLRDADEKDMNEERPSTSDAYVIAEKERKQRRIGSPAWEADRAATREYLEAQRILDEAADEATDDFEIQTRKRHSQREAEIFAWKKQARAVEERIADRAREQAVTNRERIANESWGAYLNRILFGSRPKRESKKVPKDVAESLAEYGNWR